MSRLSGPLPPLPPRIEVRTLGKISEGEELTISYVDFLQLSADRQKQLKEQFHFECSCKHCSQHISDDLMMAAADGQDSPVSGHSGQCLWDQADCLFL